MAKKENKAVKTDPVKAAKIAEKSFFQRHLYAIVICVFSFVLYANSIPNNYNIDDNLVTMNHRLTSKGISAIPAIFTSAYYNDGNYAYEYRPITTTTFAIEHSFFGDNPHMSHLINVLLYCLCCLVLYKTLLKILPGINPFFYLAVVLLFIAHPAHTEVVANIKNRDEILALLFSLLALRTSIRFVEEKKWWLLAVSVLLFILALLSKLTILSFVVIIPLTLILFSEATFSTIILIAALLITASLPLINLSSLYTKTGLGIGLLLIVKAAYFFIRPGALSSFFSKEKVFSLFKNDPVEQQSSSALLKPGTGLKPLITGIIPSRAIFYYPAILIAFSLFAISVIGLFLHYTVLFVIGAIALFALMIKGNYRLSWWAAILFYLLAILALIQFPLGMTFYDDLVAIALIYQVFFGRRDLFLPSLLLYLFLTLLNLFEYQYWLPFLYYFIAFLCLRWKYTWPVFIAFVLLAFQSAYYYITSSRFTGLPVMPVFTIYTEYYGGMLIALTLVALIFTRNLLRPLGLIFGALCLVILFYFTANPQAIKPRIDNYRAGNIVEAIRKANTYIVPGKVNRPISFIEQPVRDTSALTLRLGTSSEILFFYLHKTLLPYPMAFYYGYRFIEPVSMGSPVAIAGFVLYLFLFGLALWLIKKQVIPAFALLFFLISIAVFSNFLQSVPGMVAERFMFIPSLGWCLLFVWLLMKLLKVDITQKKLSFSTLPAPAKYAFMALLLLYSGITFARNFDWKDGLTLYTHDIDYVSNSAQANNLLAGELVNHSLTDKDPASAEKLREEAAMRYRKALDIDSNYMNVTYDLGSDYVSIANYYVKTNDVAQANKYQELAKIALRETIRIDSSYTEAHFQLATVFDQQNRLDAAVPLYYKVIETQPNKIVAYNNLSYDYFQLNRYMESIAINRLALKNIPNAHDPVINIAHTFFAINQMDSAYVWMEKAYAVAPNDRSLVEVLYDLSLKKGDTAKATFYGNILGVNYESK